MLILDSSIRVFIRIQKVKESIADYMSGQLISLQQHSWGALSIIIGHQQYRMALLGKTLKGKSARPGGLPAKKNVKIRLIAKNQDEFDQLKDLAKMKREVLRSKIATEQKIVNFNSRKLLTYWRKIMRIAKTEQLKNEIDVISQNNQRELDSNEAFIQMLDKNLDEAEDQFQIALRNHLIHTETLIQLQDSRLRGLQEEFKQDSEYIIGEYDRERREMEANFQRQIKELDNMIATVIEEDRKKNEEIKNEEQNQREETKNKDLEELNHMKMTLQTKQDKFYQELEQLHQKFTSDTSKKNEQHRDFYNENKKESLKIDQYNRDNVTMKAKIDYTRIKIVQHQREYNAKNQALKKENENISRNYQELKAKMTKFRQEEDRRLKELTNNSRNAVEKLREYEELGVKILKTAEICRRLETERQKVLPFYETTVDPSEIPEDLKNNFMDITAEEYAEFSYLNNFLKRYNKVLLDKLAIEKQKDILENDNKKLKSLLKQYLNGISLNDEVMKTVNPLLVINCKINVSKLPKEKEASLTLVEGNQVISNTLHQLGYVPRAPL